MANFVGFLIFAAFPLGMLIFSHHRRQKLLSLTEVFRNLRKQNSALEISVGEMKKNNWTKQDIIDAYMFSDKIRNISNWIFVAGLALAFYIPLTLTYLMCFGRGNGCMDLGVIFAPIVLPGYLCLLVGAFGHIIQDTISRRRIKKAIKKAAH
jgi:hypothetical protein